MPRRKADLKAERERAKKPAAGYPVKYPPALPPEVVAVDKAQKKSKQIKTWHK